MSSYMGLLGQWSNSLFMCPYSTGHEKESVKICTCERVCSRSWVSWSLPILHLTKCHLQVRGFLSRFQKIFFSTLKMYSVKTFFVLSFHSLLIPRIQLSYLTFSRFKRFTDYLSFFWIATATTAETWTYAVTQLYWLRSGAVLCHNVASLMMVRSCRMLFFKSYDRENVSTTCRI